MFLELLLCIAVGLCIGIFTGLVPGVHVNLASVILVSLAPLLAGWISPLGIGVIIITMATVHTFLDVIPSTFLGAPSPETVASVLPAHKLVLEGKGYEAVRLATMGALLSLLLSLLLFPLLLWIVPLMYETIKATIGWLILIVVVFLIYREDDPNNRFWATVLFLLSGILGVLVLRLPIEQPLLPLLSGLFGVGSLLLALLEDTYLPPQTITETITLEPHETFKCTLAATFSGWLASMLPGLGSAQAAILSTLLFEDLTSWLYLVVVGGINTVNFVLSLVTLYTLQKARNGAVASILELLPEITWDTTLVFCFTVLIAGGAGTLLTFYIGKLAIQFVDIVPYQLTSLCVLLFVIGLVFYLVGWIGLFILLISTALGVLPPLLGVARLHLMGCLLVPVMLFFLI